MPSDNIPTSGEYKLSKVDELVTAVGLETNAQQKIKYTMTVGEILTLESDASSLHESGATCVLFPSNFTTDKIKEFVEKLKEQKWSMVFSIRNALRFERIAIIGDEDNKTDYYSSDEVELIDKFGGETAWHHPNDDLTDLIDIF